MMEPENISDRHIARIERELFSAAFRDGIAVQVYTASDILKDYHTSKRIDYPLTWFFCICAAVLGLAAIVVFNVYR